jgi:simple sugar transport system permease protein
MMLFGAVIGFMVAFSTGSLWLGVLFAVLAGMLWRRCSPAWRWA